MKYRVLTPEEIEAYNIGYKNGSRQAIIKVLEFESLEEKKLYRQGYNAGCQDRKRHNVSTNEIGNNVSNVSNMDSYDSAIAITNTIVDTNANVDNKGGLGGKEVKLVRGAFVPPTEEEVLEYAKDMNDMRGVGGFMCSRQTATAFYEHYKSQGWMLGNGIHMTDWKPRLAIWAKKQEQKLLEQ